MSSLLNLTELWMNANAASRKQLYRPFVIRKIPSLVSLDGTVGERGGGGSVVVFLNVWGSSVSCVGVGAAGALLHLCWVAGSSCPLLPFASASMMAGREITTEEREKADNVLAGDFRPMAAGAVMAAPVGAWMAMRADRLPFHSTPDPPPPFALAQ